MTLTEAQSALHYLYQGDTDVPTSSEDDYTVRTGLFNVAIGKWYRELTEWRELYTTLASQGSGAGSGTKTTTASTSAYATPTNFVRPVGWLTITDASGVKQYYQLMNPNKVQLYANDASSKFYYVTGNESSGTYVNIHPTPDTSSLTINYDYYKMATSLSAGTDKFEMSDPYYAIYFVLATLRGQDGDDSTEALLEVQDRMAKMKTANAVAGAYTPNEIPDLEFELNNYRFGE